MPKSSKSQWDFGELFPSSEGRQVLTVGALTGQIKTQIEEKFGSVWVRGEVTNYRLQSSGHAYFALKDADAQLACVLFRGQVGGDRAALRDGASVILGGELTVYEPRGQYQLRVTDIEAQGVGALQAAFERLKQKLAAEGLFDPGRKRPIPEFPKCIGIVTSPTGAALTDILHVIGRRYPALRLVLAPTRVQGDGAAGEIAAAIKLLNGWNETAPEGKLDLILVARGGGSIEDLWCFNEETVARAIAASKLPVISAVGHEIDFTISDFVADLRAATPSAGAEIITQSYVASREFVERAAERLVQLARQRMEDDGALARSLIRRLGRLHPRRQLEARAQRVDDQAERLARAARQNLRRQAQSFGLVLRRLQAVRPGYHLARRRQLHTDLVRRLAIAPEATLARNAARVDQALARLRLLSPLNVLERGYSITLDAHTGEAVRDASTLQAGQRLRTRLHKGEIGSVVTRVVPSEETKI